MRIALSRTLLTSPIVEDTLADALAAMTQSPSNSFLILLRGRSSRLYKGLYALDTERGVASRLHGGGPAVISGGGDHRLEIRGLFKYDTGSREFKQLHTAGFGRSTDACVIRVKGRR